MSPFGAVVAAFLWIVAAFKVRQLVSRPHDRGLRLLVPFFVILALTISAFAAPGVANAAVEPVLGPNGQSMLRNVGFLVCIAALLAFLLYAAGRETDRRRRLLIEAPTVLVVVAMIVGWYRVPPEARYAPFTDVSQPGRVVFYVAGLLATAYLAAGLGAWFTWTIARRADRVAARGLYVAATGFVLQAPLFAWPRLAAMAIAGTGRPIPPWVVELGDLPGVVALALLVLGLGWPSLHARIAAVRLWNRHRRLVVALRPLWQTLRETFPQYALHGDGPAPAVYRNVHHQFYRAIVECRDGLAVVGRLAGREPGATDVAAEAALFHRTLAAIPDGREVSTGPPGHLFAAPDGDSAEDDAEALARLARAVAESAAPSPSPA